MSLTWDSNWDIYDFFLLTLSHYHSSEILQNLLVSRNSDTTPRPPEIGSDCDAFCGFVSPLPSKVTEPVAVTVSFATCLLWTESAGEWHISVKKALQITLCTSHCLFWCLYVAIPRGTTLTPTTWRYQGPCTVDLEFSPFQTHLVETKGWPRRSFSTVTMPVTEIKSKVRPLRSE